MAEEYCWTLLEAAAAFLLRAVGVRFRCVGEFEFHLDCPVYAIQYMYKMAACAFSTDLCETDLAP